MNTGDMLLNFEIVRELGRGGLATVYLAQDVNLRREVAVKVLLDENIRESMILHRLLVGARAAARLRHDHIIQIYYQGIDPVTQINFVAMEYLPGGSLYERLQLGRLPLDRALAYFAHICDAVEFAHQNNVIHRDLKPANVVFDRDDRLVVTDFDLARIVGSVRRTQDGVMLGTPAYMSPEQAAGQSTDHRTDIYALGIILFELIKGERPFEGNTAEIIDQHLRAPPPRLRETIPDVSERIEAAIIRALAKQPEERFQSAREFARAVSGEPCEPTQRFPIESPKGHEITLPEPPELAESPASSASLCVVGGPGAEAGARFEIGAGVSIGFGRRRNDIHIDDDFVSRAHARIDPLGKAYFLQDLSSKNGTTVNGARLEPYQPHALSPGDEIEVGYTRMRFEE